jgi:hypothetical protein
MRLIFPILLGTAISAGCALGYIFEAASSQDHRRHLWLLVYALATVGLFLWAARFLGLKPLIGVGCAVAVLSDAAHSMLGLLFFPGLVKDADPLKLFFPWLAEDFDPIQWALRPPFILVIICWYVAVALMAGLVMSRRLSVR